MPSRLRILLVPEVLASCDIVSVFRWCILHSVNFFLFTFNGASLYLQLPSNIVARCQFDSASMHHNPNQYETSDGCDELDSG